jgi:hypothetical protein
MLQLLESYSISEIIIFFIVFCLAIKEAITFYDWTKTRLQQGYNKNLKEKEDKDSIRAELNTVSDSFHKKEQEMSEGFKQINEQINDLSEKINLLINSDKDDIKAFITKEHHYFCYQKKWIDDYSLDCIEKRFEHYKQEKGNSFVESLMEELRSLPKQPPQ